jgi:hypothetical protein
LVSAVFRAASLRLQADLPCINDHDCVFLVVWVQMTWILPKMVEQDLSNTLWALGTLGHYQLSPSSLRELSSTWADAAYGQLGGGSDLNILSREQAQHLANMVWAYAQLRVRTLATT